MEITTEKVAAIGSYIDVFSLCPNSLACILEVLVAAVTTRRCRVVAGAHSPGLGSNIWYRSRGFMHYGGSVSPPREPPKKKYIVPRRRPKEEMGDSSSSVPADVKESSLVWPMLTRSNYMEWAMLMQINYEVLEIWETIDPGTNVKRPQDQQAMGALMRSVPKDMWGTLGAKKTVKEAWETMKSMRVGADRVKEISAQNLLREFENIGFKEGDTVEDFGMRITNLVATLKSLGETILDPQVVKKFLRVLQSHFSQVAVSIEMLCDMKELTVEDLVGWLCAVEEQVEEKLERSLTKLGNYC
jgi:hypothetical protein